MRTDHPGKCQFGGGGESESYDCNIVILLTVYNSVTVVLIEGINYGSEQRGFERFFPLIQL